MNYEQIRSLVAKTCMALDREDYATYLQLCSPDFNYRIVAFSKEIRREMVWLDVDRTAIEGIFEMIPRHARMAGALKRHVSVYTIEPAAGDRAAVVSSIIVSVTSPAGATQIYAVGLLEDEIDLTPAEPRLARRQVRLETRVLAPHSHIPI
jgi:methanesulfonate monooxygenase subunit beta